MSIKNIIINGIIVLAIISVCTILILVVYKEPSYLLLSLGGVIILYGIGYIMEKKGISWVSDEETKKEV